MMEPSISESSGIPKRKKLSPRLWSQGFAPLFTGQVFFRAQGLHLRGDSRRATGGGGLACPRSRGRGRRISGMVPLIPSHPFAGLHDRIKTAPRAARIAPAGLMFLAITSVGWGFNWPVTKYLLSELPPLTLRGTTGVIGALLLAALALARAQSLQVERAICGRG